MGVEVSDERKLYIRLPTRIKDEFKIRELHPDIVQVHLPRQRSRRWCVVEFESKEKREEAIVALKKTKIDNKSIKISSYKTRSNKNDKPKTAAVNSTRPLLKLLKKNT